MQGVLRKHTLRYLLRDLQFPKQRLSCVWGCRTARTEVTRKAPADGVQQSQGQLHVKHADMPKYATLTAKAIDSILDLHHSLRLCHQLTEDVESYGAKILRAGRVLANGVETSLDHV